MATPRPVARANDQLRILHARTTGGIVSARAAPVNRPTIDDFAGSIKATANGNQDVEPQRASVEYVPDNSKLVLPAGLFTDPTDDDLDVNHPMLASMRSVYMSFARLFADELDPANHAYRTVDTFPVAGVVPPTATFAGAVTNWGNLQAPGTPPIYLAVLFEVGHLQNDLTVAPRSAENEACGAYLIFNWGGDATEDTLMVICSPIEADEDSPVTLADAWALPSVPAQLSDQLSMRMGLNVSYLDLGRMLDRDMRWSDGMCQVRQDIARYRPKLTGYTTHMIAALNLPAVTGIPILAWYRAYCVAMGLVPSASSIHNTEYQLTAQLCSAEEAVATGNEHPSGAERQNIVRGAWSMLAAFGACHLANDHTWKPTDETLQRKAAIYARACRTVMPATTNAVLSDAGNLQVSMRTTMHPFGLSASIGAFYDGQVLGTIAEPLRIRTTVVPPPIARVGTVVAVMDKLRALPVGSEIDKKYGPVITRIKAYHADVVAHAMEYSDLHSHYGYADQLVPAPAQMQDVNRLLPICAAYASTFDRRDDDSFVGSALSKTLARVTNDDPGLVDLYERALQNYQDKVVDITALLASATPAAAT